MLKPSTERTAALKTSYGAHKIDTKIPQIEKKKKEKHKVTVYGHNLKKA